MSDTLETLRADGIVRLPGLTQVQMNSVRSWLLGKDTYAAHVQVYSDGVLRPIHETLPLHGVATYDMAHVVNCPHLLPLALTYADLAREYLQADPVLYSLNAHWSINHSEDKSGTQNFHTDQDDTRFLALFVYLSDVLTVEQGPHSYLKGTHRIAPDGEPYDSHGEEMIFGPAGTAFIIDPRGKHKGVKPQEGQRGLAWARFGVSNEPPSWLWDKLSPQTLVDRSLLEDERTRQMLRLVCK